MHLARGHVRPDHDIEVHVRDPVLALAALFPRTNFGLELAAVVMIFTGQVWNIRGRTWT